MKRQLVLIQGGKRHKPRRKRKERIENLDEHLLRAYPFLQKLVKRANEWSGLGEEPILFSNFLMHALHGEMILLASRDSLTISDKELQDILCDSVNLATKIRDYVNQEGVSHEEG
jgi:hypothetical protein